MGNHQAAVIGGQPEKRMRLRGHVAVRGAVEAVAAHAQRFKIAVRQSVQIRLRRQRLVEAGIKYRHLLHAREQALCGFHAAQVGVVMQRRQRGDLADLLDHLFRNQGRLAEEVAAVRNAVAN